MTSLICQVSFTLVWNLLCRVREPVSKFFLTDSLTWISVTLSGNHSPALRQFFERGTALDLGEKCQIFEYLSGLT